MKIAVSSSDNKLDGQVDPRFGRCQYFIIVDPDTMEFEAVSNESAMASGGAGIQAAQNIANLGANIVITGNVGPNAFQTLNAAGIKIVTGASGTVQEAIEKYKNGELQETEAANVKSHFGMGGGMGRGRGSGRGMGGGRGL
jgi:predicted Fe-Mo cluster-binding NifX family protein